MLFNNWLSMDDQNQDKNQINIFFLFDLLVKSYKFILSVTLISIIFGLGYIYTKDQQYNVDIDVRLVGQNQVEKFRNLTNSIISRVDSTDLRPEIIDFDFINEEKLRNSFYDEFSNYKIINLVFFEYLNKEKGFSREEASNLAYEMSTTIELIVPRREDGLYQISLSTNDVNLYLLVLKDAVNRINEEIYSGLKYEYDNILTAINHDHNTAIQNISGKLRARENILTFKKDSEVARLEEQLKIAENIDLETNLILDNPKLSSSMIGTDRDEMSEVSTIELIFSERNAYLKGTKALEQEIKNLKNREISDFLLLDSEYFHLKTLLDEKKLSVIKDKDYYLNLLPKMNEFKSVDINYELARISSNSSNKVTLFIFFVFGVFISIMYVLLIYFYSKYKST